ncbi:uracil phosphoribosyltransferase [Thalassoroseus pseudoceratinae]|uniref:uracil phosphoribosyltransferase n=1 Tax=Thalassoroseus pseudoceratinae TaxID=2713176 RepID=UPI0014236E27|nr:uracil phosphoribosyltransferase [Thalassoroseus pseudoceratinae]
MSQVSIVDHPLVAHHLSSLRDRHTPPDQFRSLVARLTTLLAFEATKDLPTQPMSVETPLTEMTGHQLAERVGLVPILRAGLGMVDPFWNLIPTAEVWHLGLYRDEKTAQPVSYYNKLPDENPVSRAFILDPMLATGGSALHTISVLQSWGVPLIRLVSLIASQSGIDALNEAAPDVRIFCAAVDPELNAQKFIVPGLGDAGDRIFNT